MRRHDNMDRIRNGARNDKANRMSCLYTWEYINEMSGCIRIFQQINDTPRINKILLWELLRLELKKGHECHSSSFDSSDSEGVYKK